MLKSCQRQAKGKLKAILKQTQSKRGTRDQGCRGGTQTPSLPKGELKAKGAPTQGTAGRGTGWHSPPFLCTKEVGTPKGRALIGEKGKHCTGATPIKRIFSLLKSGKLKASWKKAKGKLKASERQAKSELKGS